MAPIDALFMAAMDELIVLDLPGWQESSGIKREMDSFAARGRVSLWSRLRASSLRPAPRRLTRRGSSLFSVGQFAVHHLAAETAPHLLEQLAERRVILRLAQRFLAANGVHLQLMIDDHLLPVASPRYAIVARRIAELSVLRNGDDRHVSRQLQTVGFVVALCAAVERRFVARRRRGGIQRAERFAAGRIRQRHAAHYAEIDVVVRLEAEAVTELFLRSSGSLFIATSPLPSMPEADMIDASACARFCRLICEK